MELPNLAVMSVYNMILSVVAANEVEQKALLTRQLAQHKKLQTIFAFSCKQELITALESICSSLEIRFARNNKSNIISIFTFLS